MRVGLDTAIHMDEQTSAAVVFGAAAAVDDITSVDKAEWCIATSNPSPQEADKANITAWALVVCDVAPLKLGPVEDGAYPGLVTRMVFGAETSAGSGATLYIGARARNQLGLFSNWTWSNATLIGSTSAKVDAEAETSSVALSMEIPGYEDQADSDSTEIADGSKISMLAVSNKTSSLRYEESGSAGRRRLQDLPSWHAPLVFADDLQVPRRSLTSTSLLHTSNVAFTLNMGASTEEVFQYSLAYNTSDLLESTDSALGDTTVLGRLVPTLWAYVGSTWVAAKTTCTPPVPYVTKPGIYVVSVCSSAGATQFRLTLQAAPVV